MDTPKDLIQAQENDIRILTAAKKTAQALVQVETTAANLAAFEKASAMLAKALAGPEEPLFKNRKKAWLWLKAQGYKIGHTKFYKRFKELGFSHAADGSVLKRDVERFVSTSKLEQPAAAGAGASGPDLYTEKLETDIAKNKEDIETRRFKREVLEGKYFRRDQFEQELTARLAVLESGIRHMIQVRTVDYIQLVAGDLRKVQELRDTINQHLDDKFNEYADMENFQVIIEPDDTDAA